MFGVLKGVVALHRSSIAVVHYYFVNFSNSFRTLTVTLLLSRRSFGGAASAVLMVLPWVEGSALGLFKEERYAYYNWFEHCVLTGAKTVE